jgi:hypothetical protein
VVTVPKWSVSVTALGYIKYRRQAAPSVIDRPKPFTTDFSFVPGPVEVSAIYGHCCPTFAPSRSAGGAARVRSAATHPACDGRRPSAFSVSGPASRFNWLFSPGARDLKYIYLFDDSSFAVQLRAGLGFGLSVKAECVFLRRC